MTVEIKKTEYSEAEKLAEIQQAAFRPLYELYRDESNPYLRGAEDITVRLDQPEHYLYRSIYYDGRLAGGLLYHIQGDGIYYLNRVYILPELQGRGVASKAIVMFEKQLTDAVLFTLDFPIDRRMNRRCYEKAGYRDTGRREQISDKLVLACYERKVSMNE